MVLARIVHISARWFYPLVSIISISDASLLEQTPNVSDRINALKTLIASAVSVYGIF